MPSKPTFPSKEEVWIYPLWLFGKDGKVTGLRLIHVHGIQNDLEMGPRRASYLGGIRFLHDARSTVGLVSDLSASQTCRSCKVA
jgi:hypothetical protein